MTEPTPIHPDTTFIAFLLDETGSMASIKDDTIGGFNTYIAQLQQDPAPKMFTLVKFDSNRHDVVYKGVEVQDVKPLDDASYQPGASTPLLDAAMKLIQATERRVGNHNKVIVVIQTDGYENASREFTYAQLAEKVKEKTDAGWAFLFLGAGIDAFAQAGKMGFDSGRTMSYDRNTSATMFANAAASNLRYVRAGGGRVGTVASNWTDDERAATGGHMPPTGDPAQPPAAQPPAPPKSLVDDIDI